jgi:hypothetical protein
MMAVKRAAKCNGTSLGAVNLMDTSENYSIPVSSRKPHPRSRVHPRKWRDSIWPYNRLALACLYRPNVLGPHPSVTITATSQVIMLVTNGS